EAEPPQQQSNVGALRAVVGVEFVQHYVLQSRGGQAPDVGVLDAQEQLVEHFVVGQQQVGWVFAHGGAVGDKTRFADGGAARSRGFAGVQTRSDPFQSWLGGE